MSMSTSLRMTQFKFKASSHLVPSRQCTLRYFRLGHHMNFNCMRTNCTRSTQTTATTMNSNVRRTYAGVRFRYMTTNKSRSRSTNGYDHDTSTSSISNSMEEINFIAMMTGRILAAFGLVHVGREYGIDITACEGPSMMPTIQPSGEIVLIEKFSHRVYGIVGGNIGEQRAKDAKVRQKEFEAMEHKKWLGEKGSKSKKEVYTPTWHKPKLPQVIHENHRYLSSYSKSWSRLTSGIAVGDVVVLQHPDKEGTVCKRVLGLPGDIVLQPKHRMSYFSSKHRQVMDIFNDGGEDAERDDDGWRGDASLSLSNSSLTVIPDGHLWVEGDNSVNSSDSRHYGAVPANLVVGKVWMRVWPIRGDAIMVRGDRPVPKKGPFTGSTIVPAGSEGEGRRDAMLN